MPNCLGNKVSVFVHKHGQLVTVVWTPLCNVLKVLKERKKKKKRITYNQGGKKPGKGSSAICCKHVTAGKHLWWSANYI